MDIKAIGKRIQNLRLSTKTPQKSLSEFLGINELELEKIENGTINLVNSDIIEKLSDLYFCSTTYILTGENPVKNRVDFNYSDSTKEALENMAKIFKTTKNQINMDKLSKDVETSSPKTNDTYNGLSAEEIHKQRWTGLKVSSGKPSKQTYTDTSEEDIETREEKEQREFEETQWDEYFFNDFNPYGL